MISDMMKISINELNQLIVGMLIKNGLSEDAATIIAHHLILAESCGVKTHGISMIPAHINRIKNGGYNIKPNIRIENQSNVFTKVDSDNAIGLLSADYCMRIAIEIAEKEGMHTVFAKNCNTFSAAFTYTKMATDARMIGIVASNSPASMAAWNGNKKLIGTNPLAIGIPGLRQGPILFDIASSVVAKSKFNEARKRGEEIPLGWALDSLGNPTTDPVEAIHGFVMPMAGYKGYGLALCIDILTGLISGAEYADGVNKFYSDDFSCMNVGQTFTVIHPEHVCGADFYEKVDSYIEKIHSGQKNDGSEVLYPGERKLQSLLESVGQGLMIKKAIYTWLRNGIE